MSFLFPLSCCLSKEQDKIRLAKPDQNKRMKRKNVQKERARGVEREIEKYRKESKECMYV